MKDKEDIDRESELELFHDNNDRQVLLHSTDTYTRGRFQKKLGFVPSCFLIVSLFFFYGLFDGYIDAVHLILQSQSASYFQLYIFSLAKYPDLLKFMIAPVIDIFYIKAFGKSKTYLVISGLIVAAISLLASRYIDELVSQNRVGAVTSILIAINCYRVFYYIAATIWIVTLFTGEEEKTRGSLIKPIGEEVGKLIITGMFIPLNSVTWLNQYVYTQENAISEPWVTHKHVFLFSGISILVLVCLVTFFVAEKRIKSENQVSLRLALRFVPRMLKNRNLLMLTGFFLAFESLHYLVTELVTYKILQAGFPKESAAIAETLTIFSSLVAGLVYQRYLKFGYLITAAHYMAVAWLVCVAGKYFLGMKLEQEPEWSGAFWLYLIFKSGTKFATPLICFVAYLIQVVDLSVSSTIIGIMVTICQFGHLIPKSISLLLAKYIDANYIIITCMILHFIALIVLYKVARYLDLLKPSE